VLDLAPVTEGRTVGEALAETVQVARTAEALGYDRVWYAEHHNFPSIASSATAVLIAHVAAHTTTIRLGAGGIMLPNHAPLIIAEQFGTLASLHPGRIDLGLGRAPGTDQNTTLALRRDPRAAETFPEDVAELRGFLSGDTRIAGVHAYPGRGTEVPLYMLGSSLFGAHLAAELGLPYAFASHFAPAALVDAVALYRERFTPSAQLERPYVIAAVNVLAADTDAEARRQLEVRRREIGRTILSPPGRRLADDEVDRALRSPQGRHVERMFTYLALGTRDAVAGYLDDFRAHADADELITVHGADTVEGRLRSLELVAETADAAAA
jgi:luciferase family oxidoreductase group 1